MIKATNKDKLVAGILKDTPSVNASVQKPLTTGSSAQIAKSRVGSTPKQPKGESAIIRETFSLPPDESDKIDSLRMRAAKVGIMLNRSETIRAGIEALLYLDEKSFSAVVAKVPKLKTGRPS